MEVTIDPGFVIAAVIVVSAILSAGIWVGRMTYKTSDHAHSLVSLRDVLVSIRNSLASEDRKFSKGDSPLQLTKFGQEVSDAMQAEEWAKRLIKSGKFRMVKRDYEADYYARQIANSDRSSDTQKVVSIGVYQSGLDEASVRSILAIVLREEIIKQLRDRG